MALAPPQTRRLPSSTPKADVYGVIFSAAINLVVPIATIDAVIPVTGIDHIAQVIFSVTAKNKVVIGANVQSIGALPAIQPVRPTITASDIRAVQPAQNVLLQTPIYNAVL